MKNLNLSHAFFINSFIVVFLLSGCTNDRSNSKTQSEEKQQTSEPTIKRKQLRHVVLFKFKESATPEDIAKVEDAFATLPGKIPQIKDYEWGLNNSPEGLDKGFTHCFFLTFDSEEDRAIYLPHPDHKAFGGVLGPFLEDVLVLDYWNEN